MHRMTLKDTDTQTRQPVVNADLRIFGATHGPSGVKVGDVS